MLYCLGDGENFEVTRTAQSREEGNDVPVGQDYCERLVVVAGRVLSCAPAPAIVSLDCAVGFLAILRGLWKDNLKQCHLPRSRTFGDGDLETNSIRIRNAVLCPGSYRLYV